MTRREFARLASLAALGPFVPREGDDWPGYERAIVIDMLATPAPFNVPYTFAQPLSDQMIANARASGITAVNATVSSTGIGGTPFEGTVSNIAFWEREIDARPELFMKIRRAGDLRRAKETNRLGIIFGFQDGTMFDDDQSRVDLFHQLGVRIVQLTYNLRNLLGDGCLEPANAGLSVFGRQVVTRMNELGVLVDLSHCGRQTTIDAILHSTKPVGITHSACAAVNDVPRNKPDEILRRMADRGGVVGIFLMPFLRSRGQPTADDFVRHVTHAVNVCGEDHVGVGSDLSITPLDLTPEFRQAHGDFVKARRRLGISAPGEDENVFNYVPDFNTPRRMEQIAERLASAGFQAARIEKILGNNWLRLLRETIGE
jgi:membrane dipeptidase